MQYNTKKVKIIHELLGAHGVAFIEFRDLTSNKVAILSLVNFDKRYGV
jgi:hypothetical protein